MLEIFCLKLYLWMYVKATNMYEGEENLPYINSRVILDNVMVLDVRSTSSGTRIMFVRSIVDEILSCRNYILREY